jgi:hypothetical protein
MGEYHTVIKKRKVVQVCKLGTMNNMGYVTKEEAELLAIYDVGKNTNIVKILTDWSTIWRFPWPDEDLNISYLQNLEPIYNNLILQIPTRYSPRRLYFNAELELQGHNCFSPEFSIIGERHSPEGRRTIVRCESCGKLFSLSKLNLALAKKAILSLNEPEPLFLLQVASRLKPKPLMS